MPSKLPHSYVPQQLPKCLANYGYNAEALCLNLYYVFKRNSCRKKYLLETEESLVLDELVVLHHVQNYRLSILPALQCVVAIKSALKKLLLEEMPKNG